MEPSGFNIHHDPPKVEPQEKEDGDISWPGAVFGLGVLALIGFFLWLLMR